MHRFVFYISAVGVVLAILIAQPAPAATWNLTVTYTNGTIVEGPLAMGLTELPASVTATFLLDGPAVLPTFGPESVISASLPFGDGTFDQTDLQDLNIVTQYDDLDESGQTLDFVTLSYRLGGANPHLLPWIDTVGVDAAPDPCVSRFPTAFCRLARNSNFELNLFDVDATTEEGAFMYYRYTTSSQQLTRVPEPGAAGLALLGLLGLSWRGKRRSNPC